MTSEAAISQDIRDEAIGWMIASREGLTGEEQLAFDHWLDADTRHRSAWGRLDRSFNPFRVLESQHVSGIQLVSSLTEQRMSRRAMLSNGTMAITAFTTSAFVADRVTPISGMFADYSTRTGQRRSFVLPDGTALTLDARSEANLVSGGAGRGMSLVRGAASLEVPPDGSPFTIDVGRTLISLASGSLMVSSRHDECRVICREGRVDLTTEDGFHTSIAALGGVAIGDGAMHDLAYDDARDASSWLAGKIILHDRPLRELIDAFRPYRAGVLSISAAAALLRVSGVFSLDRLEEALEMVPELFRVRVTQIGRLFTRIDMAE